MSSRKDLTGQSFGYLTAIKATKTNKYKRLQWIFKCKCGNIVEKEGSLVTRGGVKSCGCLKIEWFNSEELKKQSMTHGFSSKNHPDNLFYRRWDSMKQICFNPNSRGYSRYGGRGIKVCSRWLNSFENFYEDMFSTYSPELQLDRINNDGNYEPSNCRWVTPLENTKNIQKRNGKLIKKSKYKNVYWHSRKNIWAINIQKYYKDENRAAFIASQLEKYLKTLE